MTRREIEQLVNELRAEVAELRTKVESLLSKHDDNQEKMRMEWPSEL